MGKDIDNPMDRKDLTISVIIPAKNEETNIKRCLEGVLAQSLPPIECILVDNHSSDRTVQIASPLCTKILQIENASIGALRNAGARKATGTLLAFLDADCFPENDWLLNAASSLGAENVGAVGNTVLPVSNSWVEKTWFFNIDSPPGPSRYIGSANLVVKRNIFDFIGGFDPDLTTGEDRELCWRIQSQQYLTMQDKSLTVYHYGYPKSMMQFAMREYWHGHSILSDLSNIKKSRIIFALIINISTYLCIFLLLITNHANIFSLFLLALLPFSISLIRCTKKSNLFYLPKLTILYIIYLNARSAAFVKCLKQYIFKNSKKGK